MATLDNIVIIPLLLLLTPIIGIHGLVISAVLGTLAQAMMQARILWQNRQHYKPRLDLKSPALRRMAWMGLPLLFATGGTKLDAVVDRMFASLLQPGSLSALSYGHRLTYAHYEMFVTSLMTVLFPFFSKIAGVQDYDEFGRKLFKSLQTMFWIVFPISMGIMVLHEPLVRLVFQRGAFSNESVALTGQAVFFYAMGLSAYSLSHTLGFAFYSFKNTKTPVVMGLARLVIKIALSFMLVRPMAHAGLALAESLSFIVKTALLFVCLPKELKPIQYHKVFRSFATTAVITGAVAAMVVFILPVFQSAFAAGASFLATSMFLGAALTVGAGSYLSFSLLLQPAEIKDLYRFLRAGFARG
jgi:putative peptidoglycan lipid II flippase